MISSGYTKKEMIYNQKNLWRVSDKLCISLKLPLGIISNSRKPIKAGRLALTSFREFKDSY